jgi:site-specific recombinase XerD
MKSKNYIICQKKKATDEAGYLFLISKGRNKKKKSLSLRVNCTQFNEYWNEKEQCFKSGMPNYKFLNQAIEKEYNEIEKYDGEIADIPKNDKSFINYWDSLIKVETNHGSRIKHVTVLNKLKKYLKSLIKADLKFSEITPDFLRNYQFYLSTKADPKRLSTNQVTHYLKMFKTIINRKLKEEPRLYSIHPFLSIKFEYNRDDIKRTILSEGEISKLLSINVENEKVDLWRDMLLFEIFSAGMRVSDLLLLRWNMILINESVPKSPSFSKYLNSLGERTKTEVKINKEASIEYNMYKTGKGMSIKLSINLYKILMKLMGKESFTSSKGPLILKQFSDADKPPTEIEITAFCKEIENYIKEKNCATDFVFPYLKNEKFANIDANNNFRGMMTLAQYKMMMRSESVYNRQLKKVADTLGVKSNLTSHAGRHTFAQLLLNDDVSTHDSTQAMGHSSTPVTENYFRSKFDKGKNDAVILKIGNNSKNRIKR